MPVQDVVPERPQEAFLEPPERSTACDDALGPDPLGLMEPVIYAGAPALAVAVAQASLPAARRATSIDPMARGDVSCRGARAV